MHFTTIFKYADTVYMMYTLLYEIRENEYFSCFVYVHVTFFIPGQNITDHIISVLVYPVNTLEVRVE